MDNKNTDLHPSSPTSTKSSTPNLKPSMKSTEIPPKLSLSHSLNFSSSDEELQEPNEFRTPDLSDHECDLNRTESLRSDPSFGDEPMASANQQTNCKTTPNPQVPPRIYRRAQNKSSNHLNNPDVASSSPPVAKSRSKQASDHQRPQTNGKSATTASGAENSTNGKHKTASSSGYSSPGSRSASISPSTSSASSSSSSFKPALGIVPGSTRHEFKTRKLSSANTAVSDSEERKTDPPAGFKQFSPRTKNRDSLLGSAHEPMKALPIPELQRQGSTTSSQLHVDYTTDVRLPSGNTICLVEDANSLARHKQQSASLSGHYHNSQQAAGAVRRRRRGGGVDMRKNANSFDDPSSASHHRYGNEQRRSVPTFPFSLSSWSNNNNNKSSAASSSADWNYISEKDLSASLANLARAAQEQESMPPPSVPDLPMRPFSSVSAATGRRMSERKGTNDDFYGSTNSNLAGANLPQSSSLWSLNFSGHSRTSSFACNERQRRPSLKNRLKGAFSFQNIRRAISMDKVAEEPHDFHKPENSKEFTRTNGNTLTGNTPTGSRDNIFSGSLRKAPSINSIISTVRMRKRKSKLRREQHHRNTIAIDTFSLENIAEKERPIGRVLNINAVEGTVLVEIVKPPSGPYGFYLNRQKDSSNVYISSLNDGYPEKMYAGLMKLGDEVTEVNGIGVDGLSLDAINDIIIDSDNVRLRVKPAQVHRV